MMKTPSIQKQSGLALVMAIMIVALVVTIAVEMSWRFDLSIARTSNRWMHVQAERDLEGVNHFATMVLKWDYQDDKKNEEFVDDFTEGWSETLGPLTTDYGGSIYGKVFDAQARLNLNSLSEKVQTQTGQQGLQTNAARFTEKQRRFIRLLQTINISEDLNPEEYPLFLTEYEAVEITEAVIDWMDSDPQYDEPTGSGGAEEDYYSRLDPPITIANRPMLSVSELRLVKGVTPIIFEKLTPFIIVLNPPDPQLNSADITMNINAIPVELMMALNSPDSLQPIGPEQAAQLMAVQGSTKDENDFFSNGTVEALWQKSQVNREVENLSENFNFEFTGLGFFSEYFIVNAIVEVGEDEPEIYSGKSLLYRSNETGDIQVLKRSTTEF